MKFKYSQMQLFIIKFVKALYTINVNKSAAMRFLIFTLLSFFLLDLSAQKPIIYDSLFVPGTIDKFRPMVFSMADTSAQAYFLIDTMRPNNIWQYAKVNKPGFAQTNYTVLTTDSVADYPVNDTSYVLFSIAIDNSMYSKYSFISFGITLHHKYRTDSLHDGIAIEFYDTFMHNWEKLKGYYANIGTPLLTCNYDSSYNWNGYLSTAYNVPKGGTKLQAEYARLAFGLSARKGSKGVTDTLLFRLSFWSDSVDTHKEGRLIDTIIIESNFFIIGNVQECKLTPNAYLAYYDNGSIVINSLETENRKAEFTLYDMAGRAVLYDRVVYGINMINVKDIPSAYYIVHIKNQRGVFTKKIFIGQ